MKTLQLPAEIWALIFSSSCLDGGYTGRSLSLVSRSFRELSAPYKFQSVSVTTMTCIVHFVSVLENTPLELRRVRYLFLATDGEWEGTEAVYETESDEEAVEGDDAEGDWDTEFGDEDDSDDDSDAIEFEPLTDAEMAELEEETEVVKDGHLPALKHELEIPPDYLRPKIKDEPTDEQYAIHDDVLQKALNRILTLCSETLVILTANTAYYSSLNGALWGATFPRISFPRLRELTWLPNGFLRWEDRLFSSADVAGQNLVSFPVLERLHVNDNRWDSQSMAYLCPKLQYLRAPFDKTALDQAIPRIIGSDDPIIFGAPSTVIQHLVDVGLFEEGVDYVGYLEEAAIDLGRDVKEMVESRAKLVVQLCGDIKSMKCDWEERVEGGLGGWRWNESPTRRREWTEGEVNSLRASLCRNEAECPLHATINDPHSQY